MDSPKPVKNGYGRPKSKTFPKSTVPCCTTVLSKYELKEYQ